jgi:hypothetical protein
VKPIRDTAEGYAKTDVWIAIPALKHSVVPITRNAKFRP